MHIDAHSLSNEDLVEADICVVGAGAAGITLARSLAANSELKILLLEAGGLEYDPRTQALYDVEDVGDPHYPHRTSRTSRVRFFGGTTNHWGGQARPLDMIDFESRPWVHRSGWPITMEDLEPFYRDAQVICELGPYLYEGLRDWENGELAHQPYPFNEDLLVTKIYQYSPPTRFGRRYGRELFDAHNVVVITHANVTEIALAENGASVQSLTATSLGGSPFVVRASHFVLACGGIENARILLSSNSVAQQGVGNDHDQVGRYFAEHPTVYAGTITPVEGAPPAYLYGHARRNGVVVRGLVHLASAAQRKHELLNYAASLNPIHESGYESFKRLVKGGDRTFTERIRALGNTVTDITGAVSGVVSRMLGKSNYVPTSLYNFKSPLQVYCKLEQQPNPDSRVSLSQTRDELGVPLTKLDWRFTDLDKHTVREATRLIGDEFERLGIGTLALHDWLAADDKSWGELEVNGHHTGTTRMSTDPRLGVVDVNCRVHGVANLYIAGASVFPTAGCVNPTLTIVALALRLADHLSAKVPERGLSSADSFSSPKLP